MSEELPMAPNYNTPVPNSITTPDKVETRIGTLEFFDGFPSPDTSQIVFDNLDFLRGVEVFLNGIPITSLEGLREGHEHMGVTDSNKMLLADQLLDSDPLFLTGNTDTVYCSGFLDLERDGPFLLTLRIYWPEQDILDAKWEPSPIEKAIASRIGSTSEGGENCGEPKTNN